MCQISHHKPWLYGGVILFLIALILLIPNGVAAQRSFAYEPDLILGWIVKGDIGAEETITYTVNVPSGKQIIVGAINVDAIQVLEEAAVAPDVSVACTVNGTTSLLTAQNSRVTYCRPASSNGESVPVTITLKGASPTGTTVSYALFVQRLDSSTATTFSSLNLAGVNASARAIQTFFINNTSTNVTQRNLIFSPSATSRAATLLYREDGTLLCGTLAPNTCNVYDSDWSDYYLVVLNAGDVAFTYGVRFSTP